ncbi:MAG TPA: c-type cytochrome [Planctomycetota bacterium]|nr:c-type cytochrome [Planctomycetota bacterium]
MIPILAAVLLAFTQAGDKKGETQAPPTLKIPPAPVVPPADALKSFQVAPGFRLELVAAEPLVHEPVALSFDADGRLWVAEMRGYMPDVDGKGEDQPIGDIVVLEDTDGDGKFDKSTVFLDKLVLPRAISCIGDGVLIAEPPAVYFCRSTRGELKCDQKTLVTATYCNRTAVEHTGNGLVPMMDNWIYSANSVMRFRYEAGRFTVGTTRSRGQWGITQDDVGRLFYNSNSDFLRGDLVPCYAAGAHTGKGPGVGVQIVKDQSTWPARVNPGVNRGYQKNQLKEDGRLATCTAACGPVIYRGDNFPAEFEGNAFICEPAGNLITRRILKEENGTITATNPYAKAVDFIASSDERFRPVNLYTGPDGCLYIADLYRGILEHRIYVTTFLRRQILERGLDKGMGLGRIYRVVSEAKPPGPAPRLSKAPSADLVQALSHANGWWRDTAQRLLVERRDPASIVPVRALAMAPGATLPRIHAMFVLDGMKQMDLGAMTALLADKDPRIAAAALAIKEGAGPVVALLQIATLDANVKDSDLATISGREVEFIEQAMGAEAWEKEQPDRIALLKKLASKISAEARSEKLADLLELAACQATAAQWRQRALLAGISEGKPAKEVALKERSGPLVKMAFSEDEQVRAQAKAILAWVTWPKKAAGEPAPLRPTPLGPEQKAQWERGKKQFVVSCAVCHSLSGLGEEGKGPPFVDSEWVLGSEERLVRIVANGLHGPVKVQGKVYNNAEMPAILTMTNAEIADALTYIRREWGNTAAPVDVPTVRRIRDAVDDREEPWTEKDLLKVP